MPKPSQHLNVCAASLALGLLAASVGVLIIRPPVNVAAQLSAWTKVPAVLVSAGDDDSRLPLTLEAVDFWNRTFAGLGTPFRLGPVTHTTEMVPGDLLQTISESVLTGSHPSGVEEVTGKFPGDIVVTLSDSDFVSFTIKTAGGKVLIGIKSDHAYPLTLPNVARNVIAHELGHAVGLGHNADPTKLMCGRPAPCRPDAFRSQVDHFFPLTDQEIARLRFLYPANWRSR